MSKKHRCGTGQGCMGTLKRLLPIWMAALLAVGFGRAGDAATTTGLGKTEMAAARKKAAEGLEIYGRGIEQKRSLYGLEAQDDLSQLALGDPWPLFLVDLDKGRGRKEGADLAEILTFTGTLLFPAEIQGKPRAVLFVMRLDSGAWQIGAFGMRPLARHLHAVRLKWPREKGFTPVVMTIPGTPVFYCYVSQLGKPVVWPFLSMPSADADGRVNGTWPEPVDWKAAWREIEDLVRNARQPST